MAVAGAVNTAMMAAVSEAVNAPTAQVTSTGMECTCLVSCLARVNTIGPFI